MAQSKEALVETWCFAASGEELDRNLTALDLRTTGSRFDKLSRLSKWLLGDYSAEDFGQSSTDRQADFALRVAKRENFISKVCEGDWDLSWVNSTHDEEEPHPLQVANDSEEVKRALEKSSRRINQEDAMSSQGREDIDQQLPPDPRRIWTPLEQQPAQTQPPASIPPELLTLLAEMQKGLADLTMEVHNMKTSRSTPPISSTRIGGESNNPRQVAFQNTLGEMSVLEETQGPSAAGISPRMQSVNEGIRGRWEGGNPQSQRGDPEEIPSRIASANPTFPRSISSPRDVGQIVRKWYVQFSGEQDQSAETFLSRVEECRSLARLSEEEMISSLSELFTGVAAMWYRNTKANWSTWKEFCNEFRYWYGPHRGYQERLLEEAKGRTQGPGEPVRDYVTCLLTIVKRIEPPLSEEKQIDLLHKNLQPELKKMVRRADCSTVKGFLYVAVEAELILAEDYKPPPPAERALLPEAAFAPKGGRKSRLKLAAIDAQPSSSRSSSTSDYGHTEELINRFSTILEEALKRFSRSSGSPRGSSKPRRGRSSSTDSSKGPHRGKGQPDRSRGRSPGGKFAPSASKEEKKPFQPSGPLTCSECGLLGYSRRYCPTCSGNEPKGAA